MLTFTNDIRDVLQLTPLHTDHAQSPWTEQLTVMLQNPADLLERSTFILMTGLETVSATATQADELKCIRSVN